MQSKLQMMGEGIVCIQLKLYMFQLHPHPHMWGADYLLIIIHVISIYSICEWYLDASLVGGGGDVSRRNL